MSNWEKEKLLDPDSIEYYRLKDFCDRLTRKSPNNHEYAIRELYMDFGANIKWTTIIDDTVGCQVLTPGLWLAIVKDRAAFDELEEAFFNNNSYCQDT